MSRLVPLRAAIEVASVVAVAAAVYFGRRARRVKRARALLGPPTEALAAGARVTVAGTLRVPDRAIVTHMPLGSEAPVRAVLGARTPSFGEAFVELAEARVYLGAGAQVVVGSKEERTREGTIHTLVDGDRVLACGTLESAANPDESVAGAGYRDAAMVFRLVAKPDSPLVLVSERGPAASMATVGALPALVFMVAAAVVAADYGRLVQTGPAVDWPARAAAGGVVPDRAGCGLDVDEMLARGDLAGAEAIAKSCSDLLARAHTSYARGNFVAAHKDFDAARSASPGAPPTVAEIQTASLASDFAGAAQLTALLADAWYRGPETRERRRFHCIADAFDSRAERVRRGLVAQSALKYNESEPWCNFLASDLEATRDARSSALQSPDDALQTRRLLFVEAGERGDWFMGRSSPASNYPQLYINDYPIGALYDPVAWVSRRRVALEGSLASHLDDASLLAHEMTAQAALFGAVTSDRTATRHSLVKLATPGGERTAYILGAIAALYIDDRELVEKLLDLGQSDSHAVGVIRRSALPALTGATASPRLARDEEPWNADLFDAIDSHDGARVAAVLRKDKKAHLFELLRAKKMLPPSALGPLRAWLREAFPAPRWDHGVLETGLALGARLVAAELLADTETAALLRPRVEAFARALTDRDLRSRFTDATLPNELLERAQDVEAAR